MPNEEIVHYNTNKKVLIFCQQPFNDFDSRTRHFLLFPIWFLTSCLCPHFLVDDLCSLISHFYRVALIIFCQRAALSVCLSYLCKTTDIFCNTNLHLPCICWTWLVWVGWLCLVLPIQFKVQSLVWCDISQFVFLNSFIIPWKGFDVSNYPQRNGRREF